MSVELEWHFEQEPSGQTPPDTPAPRRLHWRRWLLVAAALAIVIAVAVVLWHRERERALEELARSVQEVARLEMSALATGDTELFLSLQDSADEQWYAAQQARVLAGEPLPSPLPGLSATLPLTIEQAVVVGDSARVEFTRLAGPPGGEVFTFHGVAFYRRLSDGRWVHTAPDLEYAGRMLVWKGPRNDLAGYIADMELLEQLASELELSADACCRLLECPPELRLSLALTGTLTTADPRSSDVLPAPHLVGTPEGEDARAVWTLVLRRAMVERIMDQMLGGEAVGGLIGSELRTRVRQYTGVEQQPSVDLAALGEALAQDELPTLSQLWEETVPDEQRPAARDQAVLLMNYVEQQYNVAGVVALLRASPGAASWDALVQEALGADAASFQAGYLDYLRAELTRQAP